MTLRPAGRTSQSIGDVLDAHNGFAPGFDFLRVMLAISVLWYHSFLTLGLYGKILNTKPAWLYIDGVLPMFFALSGFLIAGSAQRLRLHDFLINRGLRIVPALAVEIVISAVVLGPILTTWPLASYFTDPTFFHYFTNIFGWIQFRLPGVFLTNPAAGIVNLSLWTVPFEVACYILMSAIILLRLHARPWLIPSLAATFLLVPVAFVQLGLAQNGGIGLLGAHSNHWMALADHFFFKSGAGLFPAFLLGIAAYYYRYRIPFSPRVAAIVLAVAVTVGCVGNQRWFFVYAFQIGFVPMMVYLTIFIGGCSIPRLPLFQRGDYSYGIYLYGFPIQQCLVASLPGLHSWVLHFLISVVAATATAMFSWHFIEKPILKQRKRFSFVGRRIAAQERERAAALPEVAAPRPLPNDGAIPIAVAIPGGKALLRQRTPGKP